MPDDLPLIPSDPPFRRQTEPGVAPGTIIPPADAAPTRIKVICYLSTEIHEKELVEIGKLSELLRFRRLQTSTRNREEKSERAWSTAS